MTREQKLALIVGFSLILFVGVLISDHLSSARKASIAKVEPEATPVSPMPMTLAAAERTTPPAVTPPGVNSLPPAPIVEIPSSNPAPVEPQPSTVVAQLQPDGPPVADTARPQDRVETELARLASRDSNLYDQIQRAGGDIVRGADGITTIRIPAAAGTSPDPRREALLPNRTTTLTPVGPIETVKTHAVVSGESLYVIAAKYYGNGNFWRELAKFNGMDKTGAVRVGMKIKVPSKETLLGRTVVNNPPTSIDPGIKLIRPAPPIKEVGPAKPATSKPGKIELASYTVRRGDTLGDISMKTLGTSKRWQEILELNKLDDEDSLTPGAVLKLPAKRS